MTKFLKRGFDYLKNWSAPGAYQHDDDQEAIPKPNYWLHTILLLATFFTTTLAGLFWLNIWRIGNPIDFLMLFMGFPFSVSLLTILGCHEFGHYFAAIYHRIKTSLPYFIPAPPIPGILNFGTFGAVIRLHQAFKNNRQLIDVGAYGPLAGFLVAILILLMAASTLPSIDYIYTIHPNYRFLHEIPEPVKMVGNDPLIFGDNIIFYLLTTYVLPYKIPMHEMYHYPLLLAGWLGLFITALNLLPFGQLDGGHILYAVAGKKIHKIVSWIVVTACIGLGLTGLINEIFPFATNLKIWGGWLVWGIVLLFVVKPWHPPLDETVKLNKRRIILAWISLIIFILCFTPIPFE